jgi:protein-S-isoprenylcysteine O-methyltransferase Ste14
MDKPGAIERWIGVVLVVLQFVLLALLARQAMWGWHAGGVPVDVPVVAAAALLLGVWTLSANPPGNFNIRPVPRAGGRLVQHGPYRWIRHPMYTTLLLAGVAAVRLSADAAAVAWWVGLAVVLVAKAAVEEKALMRRYPAYQAYRSRTRRFIPGLF